MKIIPLAFDSMGTRGMATFLDLSKKILIDPSVALSPSRYNLPPHPQELTRKETQWQAIIECAKKIDIIIITHYHYDHHNPDFPELFEDKIVIIKNPKENLNEGQKERASVFLHRINRLAKEILIGDGASFQFGNIEIICSKAVCHGVSNKLGMVIEVAIKEGTEKFLFTSDVQGMPLEEQILFILEQNPDIIFMDGPMTYLLNYRYRSEDLAHSLLNILRVINETKISKFILDHHLLRDLNYKNHLEEIFATHLGNTEILTAAEFAGKPNDLFEARRRELYKGIKTKA
jgi:predicted metallo-beta-lactamase superfamily hydrolase